MDNLKAPLDPMPRIPAPEKICRKDPFSPKKFRCDEASFIGIFDCPDCEMNQDEIRHPGGFGINRHQHVHTGVDLYAPHGAPVRAMEAGKIIAIEWFTGPSINMPWWNDTRAVYIDGDTGVFNYGEIQELPGLKVGDEIKQGQIIGHVVTVLRKAKGRPMSMLHVELYDHGWTDTWGEWKIGAPKPEHLKDPTPFLLTLADPIQDDPYLESAELFKALPKEPKQECRKGCHYPDEKLTMPFKSRIHVDSVKEHIEYHFYSKDYKIEVIDKESWYTFTKRHFLGNVGFDYEYFCEELNEWFYDSDIESEPTEN